MSLFQNYGHYRNVCRAAADYSPAPPLTYTTIIDIVDSMGLSVNFYKTNTLKCPITDFLDSLPGKTVQKITWVLKLIEEIDMVPGKYFKKIIPYDIWEVRIDFSGNTYQLLSFIYNDSQLILTHGFIKKTQKTPQNEIEKALSYKREYLSNGGWKR